MLFISGHGKKKDPAVQRKLEEEKAKIKAAKLRRNRNKRQK